MLRTLITFAVVAIATATLHANPIQVGTVIEGISWAQPTDPEIPNPGATAAATLPWIQSGATESLTSPNPISTVNPPTVDLPQATELTER